MFLAQCPSRVTSKCRAENGQKKRQKGAFRTEMRKTKGNQKVRRLPARWARWKVVSRGLRVRRHFRVFLAVRRHFRQSFPGSATPSLSRPGSATPSQSQPGSEIPSLSFHGHDIPSQSFTPELGDLAQSCAAQHSDVSVVTSQSSLPSARHNLPAISLSSQRPAAELTQMHNFCITPWSMTVRFREDSSPNSKPSCSQSFPQLSGRQRPTPRRKMWHCGSQLSRTVNRRSTEKPGWKQTGPKQLGTKSRSAARRGSSELSAQDPHLARTAEEEERTRWVHELALLVSGSDTPMGKLLSEQPGNVSVLGAGLRATTLRSKVRVLKKFFKWLALSHNVLFPTEISHFSDYLKLRLSEPCNRGALKNTNEAFGFLEEVTGMPEAQRRTSNELYQVVYRELRSSALAWQTIQASTEDASDHHRSFGKVCGLSPSCTIPAGLRLVGVVTKLGHSRVLRPQEAWILLPSQSPVVNW